MFYVPYKYGWCLPGNSNGKMHCLHGNQCSRMVQMCCRLTALLNTSVWCCFLIFLFSLIYSLQDWAEVGPSFLISHLCFFKQANTACLHARKGSSALVHLAKNLIPSLTVLAAGICALYWRDSPASRTETLTIRSGMPFFSWSLVPDMLFPSFCPRQCTHKAGCDTVPAPLFPPRNVRVSAPSDESAAVRPAACVRTRKRACACARVERDLLSPDGTRSIQPIPP